MEKFVTQFSMSDVRTNVTVQVLKENKFGFVIHLSDAFEGGEETPGDDERDGSLIRDENGKWQLAGESKVTFSEEDVRELGEAIERSYLRV